MERAFLLFTFLLHCFFLICSGLNVEICKLKNKRKEQRYSSLSMAFKHHFILLLLKGPSPTPRLNTLVAVCISLRGIFQSDVISELQAFDDQQSGFHSSVAFLRFSHLSPTFHVSLEHYMIAVSPGAFCLLHWTSKALCSCAVFLFVMCHCEQAPHM